MKKKKKPYYTEFYVFKNKLKVTIGKIHTRGFTIPPETSFKDSLKIIGRVFVRFWIDAIIIVICMHVISYVWRLLTAN